MNFTQSYIIECKYMKARTSRFDLIGFMDYVKSAMASKYFVRANGVISKCIEQPNIGYYSLATLALRISPFSVTNCIRYNPLVSGN